MLRDRGQLLVEEELETVVVHAYEKTPALEVQALVAEGVDEPDQLPFVGNEGAVAWRHRLT